MTRAISPADVPLAAWPHINALPDLYRQRQEVRHRLPRTVPRSKRALALQDQLSGLTRQALKREAELRKLGIPIERIIALALDDVPRPHTETEV